MVYLADNKETRFWLIWLTWLTWLTIKKHDQYLIPDNIFIVIHYISQSLPLVQKSNQTKQHVITSLKVQFSYHVFLYSKEGPKLLKIEGKHKINSMCYSTHAVKVAFDKI